MAHDWTTLQVHLQNDWSRGAVEASGAFGISVEYFPGLRAGVGGLIAMVGRLGRTMTGKVATITVYRLEEESSSTPLCTVDVRRESLSGFLGRSLRSIGDPAPGNAFILINDGGELLEPLKEPLEPVGFR